MNPFAVVSCTKDIKIRFPVDTAELYALVLRHVSEMLGKSFRTVDEIKQLILANGEGLRISGLADTVVF